MRTLLSTSDKGVGNTTRIQFNEGQALLHLAGLYPSLLAVVLELVQNALDRDVRATRIGITINYRTRHLAVRDNGAGVSIEKFNASLRSVAQPGRKGEGSLGQFGIGLVSPLGQCEQFIFISCAAPRKSDFHEWTFVTKDIVKQSEGLRIPVRSRPDLTLEETPGRGKTRTSWRSEMSLTGFTTDDFKSRITMDVLVGAIQDRYAKTMQKSGTVISIDITGQDGKTERRPDVVAVDYRGRPLPEQVLNDPASGETKFRLFVAKKTAKGRSGRVSVGVMGNDFTFPFHLFRQSCSDLLKPEAAEALVSGFFEGEILSEKCILHADRKAFKKDDAFVDFCCAIERWFDEYGSHCLSDLKSERQEVRFQELGLRSMKVLESLLKDPAHAQLLSVVHSFGRGTVGPGHYDIGKKKAVGEQDQSALSVQGGTGVSRAESPKEDPRNRENPTAERKPHTPLTVAGPKGQTRKVVRNSSFGLQFAHEAMEGSTDLWRLDTIEGILAFNIRHPLWIACDVRDTTLMKLQECVAMQALTLHMMPENFRPHQRQVLDEFTSSLVTWILSSDKARGTLAGRKGKATSKL